MNRIAWVVCMAVITGSGFTASQAEEPRLTIYNQDFAVVREAVSLDLEDAPTSITFTEIAAHVEPDSVILRDPTGLVNLRILEQNYRSDPVSQQLLLSLYEGQTIDFLIHPNTPSERTVEGKIIRSGYVRHQSSRFFENQQYYQRQMVYSQGSYGQPIIEVDGRLQFSLPGMPVFPTLADDTILKPTMHWIIDSSDAGTIDAQLSYITGGMAWAADYNLVLPEKGEVLEIIGWVTIDNQSGRTFEQANIKLMAGDVSKIQPGTAAYDAMEAMGYAGAARGQAPAVTERSFDEFHLYTLHRPTTLHDRETKQVEFIRADGIDSHQLYVYDGAQIDWNRYRGWNMENIRNQPEYGTQSNPKVWVMREFENTEENNLGMPLPKGRLRFYRMDGDQLEFTGENVIDHTPEDETVRAYTGNAFDLVGERRRTQFEINHQERWLDESFEIRLRNHKEEAVEIRVVEHLYRWINWALSEKSDDYVDIESQTIEFRVTVPADGEKVVTYTAHYTW